MRYPSGSFSEDELKTWLQEHDAEQSWVFDMAPVSVAPTKNVVGHVQICGPTDDSSVLHLGECARQPASDLLAIERLFVGPQRHAHGVTRYLLKESVKYIRRRGKTPVLDVHGNGSLSKELCQKLGFEEIPAGSPCIAPMIYSS